MSGEMAAILAPPLVVGLMIALTHAPLGVEVLRRGIIFIDLAVAQIAGLGLVAAGTFLHAPSFWVLQAVALAAAVLAGLFFRKVETALPEQQEAIIGASFVLAASLAVLLLADHPHGGDEIRHLLSGETLFVSWGDVAAAAPVYAAIAAAWFLRPDWRGGVGFYLIFAPAVTASVQLVGVYVVFASLILPALAAAGAARPYRAAMLCGVVAVVGGLAVALLADAPAGPVLVAAYVAACVAWRAAQRLAAPVKNP